MLVKVRAAKPEDAAAISALAQRVFAQAYGSNLSSEGLQTYLETALKSEGFAGEIAAGKAYFLLCEMGGSLAGFAKLEATNTSLEIAKFYIDVPFHGSGAASALMEAGLEWAKYQGYTQVWLLVWEQNLRAVRFYQKHGFEVVGREEVWVGEVAFQDHRMQRSLDD